jgi:hypothetical protein
MSSPVPPSEPPVEPPSESPAEDAATAQTPRVPPDAARPAGPGYPTGGYPPGGYPPGAYPPGGYPGGYPGGPAYPAASPFAPRLREPWLNPAKRGTAGLLAATVAIVLLGGGILIGVAIGDSGHGDRIGPSRFVPFDGRGRFPDGGQPFRRGDLPRRGGPATPAPSPSSS